MRQQQIQRTHRNINKYIIMKLLLYNFHLTCAITCIEYSFNFLLNLIQIKFLTLQINKVDIFELRFKTIPGSNNLNISA